MRYVLVAMLLVACNKGDDKDKEIARLKAQLAAQKPPAPNPQPETAPPPASAGATAVSPPSTLADPADALAKRVVAGNPTNDDLKQLVLDADANKSITFAHLKKNAEKYVGKPWRLAGQLLQIEEANGETTGQIALDAWGNQIVHFEGKISTDFVDHNYVEIVGLLGGNFSYTAVNGWNMTVPAILVASMTKRGGLDKLAGKKPRHRSDDEE